MTTDKAGRVKRQLGIFLTDAQLRKLAYAAGLCGTSKTGIVSLLVDTLPEVPETDLGLRRVVKTDTAAAAQSKRK